MDKQGSEKFSIIGVFGIILIIWFLYFIGSYISHSVKVLKTQDEIIKTQDEIIKTLDGTLCNIYGEKEYCEGEND